MNMEAGRRVRSSNFTNCEKLLLMELCVKYKDMIDSKKTDAMSRATEPSTVSVFLSVVKCGSVCRAQTCAHSGIRPFRLAKGFPQGGPKSSKKFEFLTIS